MIGKAESVVEIKPATPYLRRMMKTTNTRCCTVVKPSLCTHTVQRDSKKCFKFPPMHYLRRAGKSTETSDVLIYSMNQFSGLERYIKTQKPKEKTEYKSKSATSALPQILKGFNADKPSWIGGVKKSEVGGVFESGGSRRYAMGVDLAKAERAVFVENNKKKTDKLIRQLLQEQVERQEHALLHKLKRNSGLLPSIVAEGTDLLNFCQAKDNLVRVRNGPGFLKVEPAEDDVRLITLRLPFRGAA